MEKRQITKEIKRAFEGMDKDFFFSLNPVYKEINSLYQGYIPDGRHFEFTTPQGIIFQIGFDGNGENAQIYRNCSWTGTSGEKVNFVIPETRLLKYPPYPTTDFGSPEYHYSIEYLQSLFCHEPFILRHLTKDDLIWYAHAVKSEMEEWDEWLKDGSVSQDKHDEYRSCVEERVLASIAPYESDVKSIDEYISLFFR